MSLPPGDATCPYGGSKFTSASGDTYACNGEPGAASRCDRPAKALHPPAR
ncbi:MAG: hypothetical protein HY906_26915 [Deltaproteobacteria bacterium]|nr:hypothetical protein [Deltaproteobacteria bacterium]